MLQKTRPGTIACLTLFMLGVAFGQARGDVYRYVDADGVLHFTNTPTVSQYSFYMKESSSGSRLEDIIGHYAAMFALDENLVRAVIKAESDFDPRAVSSKGALGLMQLLPETAREMDVGNPLNAEENIRGGSRYLRQMLDQFQGDLTLALAAYNAGPGAVRRHGGIPPYRETRIYVDRVLKYFERYRQDKDTLL